jgi:hypothetical protein
MPVPAIEQNPDTMITKEKISLLIPMNFDSNLSQKRGAGKKKITGPEIKNPLREEQGV